MSVQKENYTRKDGSRSNEATATELQAAFATAVDWLIRADGDRDHMSTSNITCEQSMAVVALLRASDAALTRLSRRVAVLESVLCNVDPDEGLNDLDKAIVEDIHHRAVERERAEANSVAGASS